MTILSDTNIALALVQPDHTQHALTWRVVRGLRTKKENIVIVPQILYEFWVVATRPRAGNGVGWNTERANQELNRICRLFACLPDGADIADVWRSLVVQYRVAGKRAHDARLVAAMECHDITRLLTFNTQDFKLYSGLEILDPARI